MDHTMEMVFYLLIALSTAPIVEADERIPVARANAGRSDRGDGDLPADRSDARFRVGHCSQLMARIAVAAAAPLLQRRHVRSVRRRSR